MFYLLVLAPRCDASPDSMPADLWLFINSRYHNTSGALTGTADAGAS